MTKQIIVERITNEQRQSSIWAAGCYYVARMAYKPYYYEFGKTRNEARKKLLGFKRYIWLLDQLQILEYIDFNKRPLTPREEKMRHDYRKQADALKEQGFILRREPMRTMKV